MGVDYVESFLRYTDHSANWSDLVANIDQYVKDDNPDSEAFTNIANAINEALSKSPNAVDFPATDSLLESSALLLHSLSKLENASDRKANAKFIKGLIDGISNS